MLSIRRGGSAMLRVTAAWIVAGWTLCVIVHSCGFFDPLACATVSTAASIRLFALGRCELVDGAHHLVHFLIIEGVGVRVGEAVHVIVILLPGRVGERVARGCAM